MLITAIERFADRPAIADNQTRWTYRELGQAAGRLVALFRTLGLKKGDGVSLLATNRVETWAVVTPPRWPCTLPIGGDGPAASLSDVTRGRLTLAPML